MLAYEWTFGSVLWAMIVFFFWFMLIWMFIGVFADIFRRNDLTGWGKAGWLLLIFIIPLLGILIYLIARPKMTAQDKEMMSAMPWVLSLARWLDYAVTDGSYNNTGS